jgi:hypothetical protein
MTRTIFIAGALALAVTLPIAPAQALVARTFVSAAGSDSNNCANVLTPCRHLATAYAATTANGEIYVLDPANYGSLTITGPVSIEGHGWASIAPTSGNPAITINANPGDKINIIGVVLDGTALAGTTGIQFNSGGSLNVRDSVIRNFGTNGLSFLPGGASQLSMSNTSILDTIGQGINISPTGAGNMLVVLNHVDLENNSSGLNIANTAVLNTFVTVIFSDSVSANNQLNGIAVNSLSVQYPAALTVRNSTVAHNGFAGSTGTDDGVVANGGGTIITITRSTVTENKVGLLFTNGGSINSYGDNNFFDNPFGGNAGSFTVGGYQ